MELRLEVAAVAAALISGVVSFAVAWQTASRTLRTELAKLEGVVFSRLLDARLTCYPALYAILSRLIKSIETSVIGTVALSALVVEIDEWDSKYAILLGPRTTNVCWHFRTHLRKATGQLTALDLPVEKRSAIVRNIFQNCSELELALRSDLGIYGFMGSKIERQLTRIVESYGQGEAT